MNEIPKNDPIRASQRKNTAARRVGANAKCTCGESRPEALIAGSKPTICAECRRRLRGRSTVDAHHVAGRANDPTTVVIPANDHRADLSVAQMDWPKKTRENPTGCPVLRMAASIRGFTDTLIHLIKKLLGWIPEALEALHDLLAALRGPKWWIGTPLERFAVHA